MTAFLNNIFGDNVILATILIAMVPVMKLRGAIPSVWRLLESCTIIPILAPIFIPVVNLFKKIKIFNKLACAIEKQVKSKTANIENAKEKK